MDEIRNKLNRREKRKDGTGQERRGQEWTRWRTVVGYGILACQLTDVVCDHH
jgi:hypothetical protein